jgi:hypothetical protein
VRVWSLHPRWLDGKGLVALWRESLLARAVLRGETRGYRHHPQLQRFQAGRDPVALMDRYLAAVHAEATARGYQFDRTKFVRRRGRAVIDVTTGQRDFEWNHLRRKLRIRDPVRYRAARADLASDLHPLFRLVDGDVAEWERS